ncbi:hypothetical protein [Rhizobium sp. S163]|uniref:hypothetical protein n=1 Tax=Rhizobium sp. S163 TaxID=3055039 RepID=UPI0025A98DE0|nr:hypothetical protein [Rhizobium sp. S163]MDM9644826.1 hypothetical protein [Rhizobium sp. S163]
MSYLVEILLPITGDDGRGALERVRNELTEVFGGVTMHVDAPAEGIWKNEGDVDRDKIVVVEVMTEHLNREWWENYRRELEARLGQDEIVIRAAQVERL